MLFQDVDHDRRQYARVGFDTAVEIVHNDWTEPVGSLAADISEGGMRLKVSEYIQSGAPVTLRALLDNRYVVEFPARVVWVEKNRYDDRYQAGVEFLAADATQFARKKIQEYIKNVDSSK